MADAATPTVAVVAAATASGVFAGSTLFGIPGVDGGSLGFGLVGVVIAQTLLPRTVQTVGAAASLAVGSMLLSAIMTPFAGPFVMAMIHRLPDWEWLMNVSVDHVRNASAALIGGFAQQIFTRLRGIIGAKVSAPTKDEAG